MDTPTLNGPDIAAAAQPAGTASHEPTIGRLLPGLWLATAVGLVVVPFLTQFRVVTGYQDEALESGIPDVGLEWSSNGWGQWDGLAGGHDIRTGILFAVMAGLLVFAVVATIGWRRSRWPLWLGLLAGTMTVTAIVLHLVELEASRYVQEADDPTFRSDMTFGLGAWLVPGLGALAATAVVLSLARIRRLRLPVPQRPTPTASAADRLALVLAGLWITAAIGLFAAPFLTVYEVSAADNEAFTVQIDGWGRTDGSLGIPCATLAICLAGAAIAVAVRRTAILPLRIGLLAGAAAVVVGGFLRLRLESMIDRASPSMTVSIGAGGWLVLAAAVLAAVTVALTLVRQWQLRLH